MGTGPLVDPGFEGKLLIPLHSLTADDYEIEAGEGLIWVEFTKLSPNERWNRGTKQMGTPLAMESISPFRREGKIDHRNNILQDRRKVTLSEVRFLKHFWTCNVLQRRLKSLLKKLKRLL